MAKKVPKDMVGQILLLKGRGSIEEDDIITNELLGPENIDGSQEQLIKSSLASFKDNISPCGMHGVLV
jgi:hypothetical protein